MDSINKSVYWLIALACLPDSKAGEVGRDDCDPSRACFWKMDGDDSDRPCR
jgi:hypothetical protein